MRLIMITQLEEIKELTDKKNKIKSVTKLESPGFFDTSDPSKILDSFFEKLEINSTMSLREMVSVLQYLENVSVRIDQKPTYASLAQVLSENNQPTLQSLGITSVSQPVNVRVKKNSPLCLFLIENHQLLVNFYQQANAHIEGHSPVSEMSYSSDELSVSQAFYDMEKTTVAKQAPDQAEVIGDIKRQGVTFYGAVVYPRDMNDPKDRILLQAIQDFAGDSLDDAHSKANKILNFGGQFMEGVLLQEFMNTTKFLEETSSIISPGSSKGHINWAKESETGHVYAFINLKILACSIFSPENNGMYAMASDGSTLIALDGEDLEKVLARCADKSEEDTAPICEIDAKIGLVPNEENKGYILKVEQFNIKYYTPSLVSTHSEELDLEQRPTLG